MKRKPISLSDLLAEGKASLERIREGARAADRARTAVQAALPAELAGAVWGASLEDGVLTVLVENAGWGTRLRYEVPLLKAKAAALLEEPVEKVVVRVRPRPKG